MALSRFTNIWGWPSKIFSDCGTQIVEASDELRPVCNQLDEKEVLRASTAKSTEWVFGPAIGPWHHGALEELIKSARKPFIFMLQIVGFQHRNF